MASEVRRVTLPQSFGAHNTWMVGWAG